jgi:ADP-heptose:LPS heptosyltransferase
MPPAPIRTWVRAPDHLGDGVLARPSVEALARLGPVWAHGPGWIGDLYADILSDDPLPGQVDQRVLLKPGWSALRGGPRAARTLGLATDHRWPWLDVAVLPGAGHRIDDFARVARAAGAAPEGPPRLPAAAPVQPDGELLLLPLTRSGPAAEWPRFRALADRLAGDGRALRFAAGPGEDARLAEIAGPHPRLPPLPLPAFGARAAAAAAVLANDSGLAHLAAAARRGAGRDPAAVIVLLGPTAGPRTAPPGATLLPGAPLPCWPCYRGRCPHGAPCWTQTVDEVLAALRPRSAA